MQLMVVARLLALLKAGKSIAARIAMMAITTNNSIRVNAARNVLAFILKQRRLFTRKAAPRYSVSPFMAADPCGLAHGRFCSLKNWLPVPFGQLVKLRPS